MLSTYYLPPVHDDFLRWLVVNNLLLRKSGDVDSKGGWLGIVHVAKHTYTLYSQAGGQIYHEHPQTGYYVVWITNNGLIFGHHYSSLTDAENDFRKESIYLARLSSNSTMTGIHYRDLASEAHRGPLQRGMRYVYVNRMYATEGVTASMCSATYHTTLERTVSVFRVYRYRGRPVEKFCDDYGHWDCTPSGYRNVTNYTLDVAALMRQGVVILDHE